jgi:thiamine biosynthesis lipoprotein
VGKPLDGKRERWGVGITDPDEPGGGIGSAAILDTAYVADMAVTTAGDYQRYYTVNGVRYSHIIDPETRMPATRFRSVTVAAPDSGVADFLDTLLFILPYEDGQRLVESLQGVDALWVLPDGTLKATDGMRAMLSGMGGAGAD